MNTNRDQSWIDLLLTIGKELGVEAPGSPAPQRWSGAPEHTIASPASQRSRLIESSETMSREALAGLLEGLAGRFRDGAVSLRAGSYSVHVDLPDDLTVDLTAASQEGAAGTEFELGITVQWRAEPADDSGGVRLD